MPTFYFKTLAAVKKYLALQRLSIQKNNIKTHGKHHKAMPKQEPPVSGPERHTCPACKGLTGNMSSGKRCSEDCS